MAAARSHETVRIGRTPGADPPSSQVRARRRPQVGGGPRERLRRKLDAELTRQGAPPVPYLELERDGWLVLVAIGGHVERPIVVAAEGPIDDEPLGRSFLVALVDALAGDRASALRFTPTLTLEHLSVPTLRRYLLRAAAQPDDGGALAGHTAAKLPSLPLLRVLGPDGRARQALACDVLAAHGRGPIPYVEEELTFRTLDWTPLLITDDVEHRVASAWLGVHLERADHERALRRVRALRDARRAAVAALPLGLATDTGRFDPECPPRRAHAPDRWIAKRLVEGTGDRAIRITLGLRPIDDTSSDAGIELFCDGCPVEETTLPGSDLPVLARVDVRDETLLTEALTLRPESHRVLLHALEDASLDLAQRIVDQASGLESGHILFSDAPALRLMAALLRRSRGLSFHLALRGSTLSWPTVQGGVAPFAALETERGRLLVGERRYPAWISGAHSGSKWDRPIVHTPPGRLGDALRAVLVELGVSPRSATSRLATVQARRAQRRRTPELAAPPAHRLLRAKLSDLGASSVDGEIELIEGPASEIVLFGPDGEGRELASRLAFPIRAVAVARGSGANRRDAGPAILSAIERAALRLLARTTGRFGELPGFVRSSRRAHVLSRARRAAVLSGDDGAAPVFLDTSGRWLSLAEIVRRAAKAPIRFTAHPPPYPAARSRRAGVTLRLTPSEAASLARLVSVVDATEELAAALAAERRASAATVEVTLPPATRASSSTLIEVRQGSFSAVLGLLRPGHAQRRGVDILSRGRPLCRLSDAPGWPIAAIAEDDRTVAPNAAFDGPRRPESVAAIIRRIRAAADDALSSTVAPPDDALVAMAIGELSPAGPAVGYLWLPARFPRLPVVEIISADRPSPWRTSLSIGGLPGLSATLPVEGRIAVTGERPPLATLLDWMHAWAEEALRSMPTALLDARRQGASPRLVDAFRWNLALLGSDDDLIAPTTTGWRATAPMLRKELRERGRLWYVDRQSTLADASVRAPAGLVLVDDGSPLLEVLQQRSELSIFRGDT